MPTMKYKSNQNEDTAYCDGHKVQLIAVPAGTLQKPIHATSDAGYVVDGNGNKHRVLMAVFLSGTPDYKPNETSNTAYLTVNGQKVKVRLASKENGTLTLSDSANVNKGYAVGTDGEKHRVLLVNTPSGTLELPNSETDDSAYVIGNGKKTKVRMFVLINGAGIEVVVGPAASPLSLPDAVANSLSYVKAYGGLEQNGTPTPDAPATITCNNGILKVRHQSGLPLGYQPYEYITAGGNQWLDTGVKLANTDIVETEFKNSSSTGFGALYGVFAIGDSSAFYANGTYYGYDVVNNKVNTGISVDTNWHTLRQDFGNGIITLDGSDTTYTPFEFDNSKNNYLFARYYSSSYGYGFKGSCKRFKVIRNGVVICDLIPAVQLSDNEIGMYDLVNDVFRGNVGSGDFTATNPVNDLEIYVDGTVETIEDTIGNSATCEPLLAVGDYTDVQSILDGVVTRNVGVKVLTGEENFETATATNCYSLTNTLGTGNFADRTIVCSHFDSTSTQPGTGDRQGLAFIVNKGPEYTIAFGATTQFSTQAQWKDWLAAQSAAGTPVIVVYPLATPTTEVVAGQTLQVQAGNNTIEITQASMSGLQLEAKYMKEE